MNVLHSLSPPPEGALNVLLPELPARQAAYAGLYFTSVMWPSFGCTELEDALAAFAARERRFGRIG